MTREELREAVARAMLNRSPLYSTMTWDGVDEITREMWRGDADAALAVVREAMREPSAGMVHAARWSRPFREDEGDDESLDRNSAGTWAAMLAASPLAEPGE